jgi:hypothetical protein
LPAAAKIKDDGSFTVATPDAPGLVPGEYGAAIMCWKDPPDERHAGKSAIAARYNNPMTSELKVKVDDGAKPIFLSWDIKSK